METFNNIKEVLDFAIKSEEEAVAFYTQQAEKANSEAMRKTFLSLAKEEEGHAKKIKNLDAENIQFTEGRSINDLHISDYLNPVVDHNALDYSEVLVIAINREKRAYLLYSKLAEIFADTELQKLFYFLAKEESKHKNRFEIEYDDYVLREN